MLPAPAEGAVTAFVPLLLDHSSPAVPTAAEASIEVEIAGAKVRVGRRPSADKPGQVGM
jgi:hypothetical protein